MNKSKIARLQDVAEEANVSIAAASLILNKKSDRFSKKTCEKVFSVAKSLGWYRNSLSSSIQSGKTKTVGVLLSPDDSYYSGVLWGIHKELADNDYVPITLWADAVDDDLSRTDNGLKQIDRLVERRVDGLILRPVVALAYEAHFQELMTRNIPIVVIDHELRGKVKADTVESDEEQGTRFVAEHLVSLGHKRICYLGEVNFENLEFAVRRKKFFEFALSRVPDVSCQSYNVNFVEGNEKQIIKDMLQSSFKPTAIFCIVDRYAKLVYQVASTLGLNIPEDLSVVGFADLDFSSEMVPSLTTVRHKAKEIGCHAAKVIMDRAEGRLKEASPHCIRLSCDLIVRNSTGPAKNK